MADNPVKITIDKTKLIEQAVGFLTANKVYVGIASDQAEQPGVTEGGKFNTVTGEKIAPNLAMIGYVLEFGSPVNNVPARPHLVPGVEEAQDKVTGYLKQAGKLALDGNIASTEKAFMAAGFSATTSVKRMINSNIEPALSERTLAARKAKGVTRTDTLVDTGGVPQRHELFYRRWPASHPWRQHGRRLMPLLDVSEVLSDPDFSQVITIQRNAQTVNAQGRAVDNVSTFTIQGVITIGPLDPLVLNTDAAFTRKSIAVHTRTQLYDVTSGFEPDNVLFEGNVYLVKRVYPWNQYGAGFYAADCEMQDLVTAVTGSAPAP